MTDSDVTNARRVRVLLTGFGPFPAVAENASARLVQGIAPRARTRFPDADIECDVLPTEWRTGPARMRALIAAHDPDVILAFGVAQDERGFRLETQARNGCRLAIDAAGLEPLAAVLCQGGPSVYPATGPIAEIADRLAQCGYAVSLSDDAGGYLCNAVFYHALECAPPRPRKTAFVHIPVEFGGDALTFDDATDGAIEILGVAIASALQTR